MDTLLLIFRMHCMWFALNLFSRRIPKPDPPMAFLTSLFTSSSFPINLPSFLFHQSHSADYDYGVRGGHAKPCRACSDFQSWMQTSKAKQQQQQNDQSPNKPAQNNVQSHPKGCPLDKDELGRNSWSLLHTMAAYYPDKPSHEDQTTMNNFIQGLARFYPCESCASDFRRDIGEDPPDTSNRVALSSWWCRMHNRVNRKLGKPEFDCSKVDERWLDGWKDGSCG